jgi:hypothetical protein
MLPAGRAGECRSRVARKGPRCGLAAVLAVAVCATLAYARSYAAIGKWAADSPTRVREGLGLWSGAVPDPATIWRARSAADRPGWTRCPAGRRDRAVPDGPAWIMP